MATSAVPAAITALLAILRADAGLTGVSVTDGPPVGDQSDRDYVSIGWQPDGDRSVEIAQDFNSAGARTRDEEFVILCYLFTWTGDSDISVVRARAFTLLAAIENAIRATGASPTAPTLNGSVLWAHLTSAALEQANTNQGVRAGMPFTITCRARI